jgi:catechol 2,3-dioxygenase-like lactoylglutathione lyase family enzyme
MTGKVTHLARIERTVASLPAAIKFYGDALGFTVADAAASDPAGEALYPGYHMEAATLRLGDQRLRLTSFDPPGRAYPAIRHSYDPWFQHFAMVTLDIEAAYRRLRNYNYAPITKGEPVLLPASSGGVSAYKFRDPDGHPLEFLQFPSGDPRAQTIGIDHTAIAASNMDASIGFYCGLLGLTLAARQINRGSTQERLDSVPDAQVDIVALNPATAPTPHLELLIYHNIAKPPPSANWMPWDIAGDRIAFAVQDLAGLLAQMNGDCILRVAPQGKTALIRDPDGHLLMLAEG